ncbi:hypothetical protein PR048_018582 [Dryococelus australis]|uniref:ATP-dependent DNA helicase n=1 Tax=Dryococelus australis TaxID=614101 RepID=A0ABQ9HCV7_9NEOP|nr:hypothetical protein PR048_018582 [Dryococelus australis]
MPYIYGSEILGMARHTFRDAGTESTWAIMWWSAPSCIRTGHMVDMLVAMVTLRDSVGALRGGVSVVKVFPIIEKHCYVSLLRFVRNLRHGYCVHDNILMPNGACAYCKNVTLRVYLQGSKQEVSDVGARGMVHHMPQSVHCHVSQEAGPSHAPDPHFHVIQEAGPSYAPDPPVCITRGADSCRGSSRVHVTVEAQQSHAPEPAVALPAVSSDASILSGSILMDETIVQQLLGPFYEEESAPVLILQRQDKLARSRAVPMLLFILMTWDEWNANVATLAHYFSQMKALNLLHHLLNDDGDDCIDYRQFIRNYNAALSFASFCADCIVESPRSSVYTFQIYTQMHHLTSGAAHPPEGKDPRYNQLYFIDVDAANAAYHLLHEINPLAQLHKSMHEVMAAEEEDACQKGRPLWQVTLTLKQGLGKGPNVYNLPAAVNDVAAIFMVNALPDPMTHPVPTWRTWVHEWCLKLCHCERVSQPIIAMSLEGRQQACHRPDVVCRVVKVKLDSLIDDIHNKQIFGKLSAYTNTIEFLKRELRHAHIVIILDKGDKTAIPTCCIQNVDYLCLASGTIPAYSIFRRCYVANLFFTIVALSSTEGLIIIHLQLLALRCAVIGMSCRTVPTYCSSLQATRYLNKYIQKGHESAVLQVGDIVRDEVTSYRDSRYVSSPEACWRLLSFKMADKNIIAVRLALHLENRQSVFIQDNDVAGALERVREKNTHLTAFFHYNSQNKLLHQCVWVDTMSSGHYLCGIPTALLLDRKTAHVEGKGEGGPTSFQDLQTVHHTVHPTYMLACMDLLRLDRDDIYQVTIYEVAMWSISGCLRELFSRIFLHCNTADPLVIYNNLKPYILDDIGDNVGRVHGLPQYEVEFECNEADSMHSLLNADQNVVFTEVVVAVAEADSDAEAHCRVFFGDGPGGSGKTFLYNCIIHSLRADNKMYVLLPGYALSQSFGWRLLQEVAKNDCTKFGSKVLLLGGDFRQVLPVVSHGGRADQSTLGKKSSSSSCFTSGGGGCPSIPGHPDGYVKLPDVLVLPENADICNHVFGHGVLTEEVTSVRAIPCPRNKDFDEMNAIMVARLGGDRRTFLSHNIQLEDSTEDSMNVPIEFLNSLTVCSLLPHSMTLAVGPSIMLIRNLNTKHGLCNGTRLVVINLNDYVIDAKLHFPFSFVRRQFSICLAFAMAVNKSRGQTFNRIGIYLPNHVFSHGQLYVALSRAKSSDSVSVLAKQSSAIILPREHKRKKAWFLSETNCKYVLWIDCSGCVKRCNSAMTNMCCQGIYWWIVENIIADGEASAVYYCGLSLAISIVLRIGQEHTAPEDARRPYPDAQSTSILNAIFSKRELLGKYGTPSYFLRNHLFDPAIFAHM